jgi:hypothetical protein
MVRHPQHTYGLRFIKPFLTGHIVRIAPNELSISDPEAIKTIYGVNSGFIKVSTSERKKENKRTSHQENILTLW